MGRITGIGGIFFKCDDPEKVKEWYQQHFSLKTTEYGATFEFRALSDPQHRGYLQWSPFKQDSKYMDPSSRDFMINYRVEGIEELVEELKASGAEVVGEIEEYEYGKFAHVIDPAGIKIELWEPIDKVFTDLYDGTTNAE